MRVLGVDFSRGGATRERYESDDPEHDSDRDERAEHYGQVPGEHVRSSLGD
jgi:hypothetical protein